MKIIKQKKIEGCLEGANVKDIMFDNKITKEFVLHLGKMGKLIFDEELKKPFFRVIVRGKFTMKGSVSNKTIRLLLPATGDEEIIETLKNHIETFDKQN
ncbi:hypothetical protein D9V86_04345 [Bacteroidetes/Chlorobi group bacterium ChocPot_Mid]|jgi:hypothetical protein|nr:MAG: hypothetical protein D9V86_04345 [Bacteroidetes/Chlorobi group bacterium ChocPot_Mid]